MSRINTNVSSMISQRNLGQANRGLSNSLERLSTGLRINRGADDPSGLIASEALRSEIRSIDAAIGNAERAEKVVNIAEGGLQEVNSLLLELQSLVGQSANEAGISADEKEANQLEIDSILQTIDRISQTTSFQGTKLLNGTYDFQLSGQNVNVNEVVVNGAKLDHNDNRDVQVIVTQSAQRAGLLLSMGGGVVDLSGADEALVFDVAGTEGSRQFTFASGTSLADVTIAINTFSDVTGVSAAVSGTGVVLKSRNFGEKDFVSVEITDDGGQAGGIHRLEALNENDAIDTAEFSFASANVPIRDLGQDVEATINGVEATTNGRNVRVATDFLDVELELNATGATTPGGFKAVTITGGGARFNLGPNVDILNQVSIGIENVASRNLGSSANGYLSSLAAGQANNVVDGDLGQAQKIVNDAIASTATLRGRLGAFQKNTIGATIRSLGVALENTSAAESTIRDTDFAKETADLTRNQILVQASTNILGISNSRPQAVLGLLG